MSSSLYTAVMYGCSAYRSSYMGETNLASLRPSSSSFSRVVSGGNMRKMSMSFLPLSQDSRAAASTLSSTSRAMPLSWRSSSAVGLTRDNASFNISSSCKLDLLQHVVLRAFRAQRAPHQINSVDRHAAGVVARVLFEEPGQLFLLRGVGELHPADGNVGVEPALRGEPDLLHERLHLFVQLDEIALGAYPDHPGAPGIRETAQRLERGLERLDRDLFQRGVDLVYLVLLDVAQELERDVYEQGVDQLDALHVEVPLRSPYFFLDLRGKVDRNESSDHPEYKLCPDE